MCVRIIWGFIVAREFAFQMSKSLSPLITNKHTRTHVVRFTICATYIVYIFCIDLNPRERE